jgi:hypothetical protein
VLADTLGSAGVIVSTLMIRFWGWHLADPIASLVISVLILLSVVSLVTSTANILLSRVPEGMETTLKECLIQVRRAVWLQCASLCACGCVSGMHVSLCVCTSTTPRADPFVADELLLPCRLFFFCRQIARQPLVVRVTKPHFWKLQGEVFIGTVHLEVEDECDEHVLRKRTVAMLTHCGVSQVRTCTHGHLQPPTPHPPPTHPHARGRRSASSPLPISARGCPCAIVCYALVAGCTGNRANREAAVPDRSERHGLRWRQHGHRRQ